MYHFKSVVIFYANKFCLELLYFMYSRDLLPGDQAAVTNVKHKFGMSHQCMHILTTMHLFVLQVRLVCSWSVLEMKALCVRDVICLSHLSFCDKVKSLQNAIITLTIRMAYARLKKLGSLKATRLVISQKCTCGRPSAFGCGF